MLSFKQHLKKQRSAPVATKKCKKTQQEGIELSASDFIIDPTAMDSVSPFANGIAEIDDDMSLPMKERKLG